jgi:hypothetical protein
MPPKQKTQEEMDPNLKLAFDYLNKECPWIRQSLGEKWFLEFAKGLRFFVETHDVVIDYGSACKLLNKNKEAIEKSTDLLFNLKVGGKEVRRFDSDQDLKNMFLSLVAASVVIAKVYHIDPLVYVTTLSMECPSSMKLFNDQLDSQNRVSQHEKKYSKTGKGAFQLTYNSFPRCLINDELENWKIERFQRYIDLFNTNANLPALQQDVDFSNPAFLHVNPFANALGATLTMYWFLYERHVKKAKKGSSFGPEDVFLHNSVKKELLKDYNGGEHKEDYSREFMKRYDYFKNELKTNSFSGDWHPIIAKL